MTGISKVPLEDEGLPVVGVVRAIEFDPQKLGAWTERPDGSYLYHVSIQSPGAMMVRLHFENVSLPEGAKLYVYATKGKKYDDVEGPFTGRGLWDSGEFWSTLIAGDTIVVEYYNPKTTAAGTLPFSITGLGHVWSKEENTLGCVGANTQPFFTKRLGDAYPQEMEKLVLLGCHPDARCTTQTSQWRNAVGYGYRHTSPTTIVQFSGTLLADNLSGSIPWFLTARHAVSSQQQAQTVVVVWKYYTNQCNGTAPNPDTLPKSNGATYITGTDYSGNDFALLRLNGLPSGWYTFSGYTSSSSAPSKPYSVHHPDGSYMRYAKKNSGSAVSDGNYWKVYWSTGTTEVGSSGAGLWNDAGYLVGQVSTGSGQCPSGDAWTKHGKFSYTWPRIRSYLGF